MYAKSTQTIAKIIEAAKTLFTAKNFTEVTMSEIAEMAEVTKGALYHHFASKDELYLKMMHDNLTDIQSRVQPIVTSNGSSRDKLHRLAVILFDLPQPQQTLIQLVRRDINIFQDPTRSELIRAYQVAMPEQVEIIIQEGMENGEIAPRSARLLSWEYIAVIEVVCSDYARQLADSPEEVAEHVTRMFFNGASE
ncbi:MAG: TetR/AcrR family transcriptional regulator [Chloroflexi bacterium]|nr:TetR/AcrR family transcriptional regulator [Chloroflexota bacterium]